MHSESFLLSSTNEVLMIESYLVRYLLSIGHFFQRCATKMLSRSTLELLESISRASSVAYPEGGALWTYIEAANQAHSKFRDARRGIAAGPLNIEQLGKWLQWSHGDRSSPRPESVETANHLMKLLRSDLDFDEVLWTLVEDGSDMRAIIHMARNSDNRQFSLELFWSED
jgi:hypothetical protein